MTDAPAPSPGTEPAAAPHGRAGRNLASAFVIGASLGIFLVLLPVLYLPWLFSVIVSLAMLVSAHELRGALANRDVHVTTVPLYIGVAALPQAAGPTATSPTPPPRSWSRRTSASWPGSSGSCSPPRRVATASSCSSC
jgi:hypothetical protein